MVDRQPLTRRVPPVITWPLRKLFHSFLGVAVFKRSLLGPLLFLSAIKGHAQFYNLPNDQSSALLTEKVLAKKDSAIHSGIQPYIPFFSEKYQQAVDSSRVMTFLPESKLKSIIFRNHLIRVRPKEEKFALNLDPVLNFESGYDLADSVRTTLYTNTRGLIASGHIGDRFYFETLFAENQSVFPTYISDVANATLVVPGQGRWKSFKANGYDYAFSSGFVSIQPAKFINIQVGHGKQKIGHGYRSLLLSDNAFNYPFARITQQWFKGRVQYSNIYAVMMNLVPASQIVNPNSERLYQKKATSFQYLSLNATPYLNLGFFQGLIWQAGDEKNKQNLDWQYFNPIIYGNAITYGLDYKNNVLVGADLKLKLGNRLALYGQVMLDNMRGSGLNNSGSGWQAGLNYFCSFGPHNLFLQAEYNLATKNSYTSPPGTVTDQSYFHYNQNMAYTPNEGQEFLVSGNYRYKRCFLTARCNLQAHDPGTPAESNSVALVNGKIGYLINPSYNLSLALGMIYRKQNFYNFTAASNETNYIYIGFKTSLYNVYYDF